MIHPTALIDSQAQLGENVSVGPYTLIQGPVKIGSGTVIASCVRIEGNTEIGEHCRIFHGAAIGGVPQDLRYKGEKTFLKIGSNNTIREFVTINLATLCNNGQDDTTLLGSNNLLMAYVHIAHNCKIGNNVIMSNAVNLAGHIVVEDFAIIGGMTPVHQFVHIGCHCMVGGASRVTKDVVPYTKVAGSPMVPAGLNTKGLHRRGFTPERIRQIKEAYRILYRRSDLNVSMAVAELKKIENRSPEVNHILEFIENSERGICK